MIVGGFLFAMKPEKQSPPRNKTSERREYKDVKCCRLIYRNVFIDVFATDERVPQQVSDADKHYPI